ncbi:TPA: hypothetical protein VDU70_005228 [Pseudomonas aeruginosa]|nr:hypothetical protein [Pseudomonas aeruginosa]HEP8853963.1 hypothetical protein [Pseudomonas aeruginosa]
MKKKFYLLIILLAFTSASSYAIGPTPGKYKLTMPDRPDTPYQSLDNYTPDLTDHGAGPDFTVEVARHHIIPYDTLRTFFNNMMARGDHLQFRGVFSELGVHIPHYGESNSVSCSSNLEDFANAASISLGLASGRVRPGGVSTPTGWDTFEQFYAWMPWNIFIGPINRADDPGQNFERQARYIVSDDRLFGHFMELNDLMIQYNQQDSNVDLRRIVSLFRTLSRNRYIYPLEADQWERLSGGRYRIRERESYHRTPSMTKKTSDACYKTHEIYASFLYILGL